jgi:hypothetical protein
MKPTFDQTVNVLVKAYLNDELAHKVCSACAVGNLVAHALGTKPKRNPINSPIEFDNTQFEDGTPTHWYYLVQHEGGVINDMVSRNQCVATGYTVHQLRKIESAFENAEGDPGNIHSGMFPGRCIDPVWMFNGLMAVVDVLAEIHEVDLSVKEKAKTLFIK